MTRTTSFFAMVGLMALCAACPAREVSKVDPNQQRTEYVDVPVEVNRDIDILFVIDNSISMGGEQASLVANFPAFINVLNNIVGGLPNVHIGVVTSDVGVGGNNVGNCLGAGDNGLLQNSPSINQPGCPVPMGRYISDVDDGMGGRTQNYSGTLAANFSCIAELGTTGCGFEQHFESMKRALNGTNTENNGFLRTDAFLAVIFVADEDDCSANNQQVFDATQTGINDPLGPLTSFRCFEFGVTCSPTINRAAQNYSGCAPRGDSYLYDSSHYVDFLRSLKPAAPQNIIVAGIIGNPEPVSVSLDQNGFPGLVPSCTVNLSEAFPGIRFKALLDAFPNRSTFTSICNADLTDALIVVAELLAQVIGNPCLQSNIDQNDLFPNAPGLQLDCQVSDVVNPNESTQTETPLPRCKMIDDTTADRAGSSLPCWWVVKDDAQCCQCDVPGPTIMCPGGQPVNQCTPTGLVLNVERNSDPVTGTHVIAKCLVL